MHKQYVIQWTHTCSAMTFIHTYRLNWFLFQQHFAILNFTRHFFGVIFHVDENIVEVQLWWSYTFFRVAFKGSPNAISVFKMRSEKRIGSSWFVDDQPKAYFPNGDVVILKEENDVLVWDKKVNILVTGEKGRRMIEAARAISAASGVLCLPETVSDASSSTENVSPTGEIPS